MKRKNLMFNAKKAMSLTMAVTLTVSMVVPTFAVEAQEPEVQVTEAQETEEEVIEDRDYVVYIDVAEEPAHPATEKTVSNDGSSQTTISQNAVSENTLLEEYETQGSNNKDFAESNQAEAVVNVQESIEKAQEILTEDGAELVKDEETIIYTADLTQKEIQELQESDVTIVVEENIELFGAGQTNKTKGKVESKEKKKETSKEKSKETPTQESKKQDNQKSDTKKDSEQKKSEKYELKMAAKQSTVETENEEPEWNVSMVNGNVAAQVEGETVKVAVMDSGIELLSGIPVEQINNLVASEQDLPYYMNDMTGHGTAIAGIINDIAPNAEIYSVRIMDAENKATLSRVVEGIYWCIDDDIDIINMSFGTTVQSAVLEKAIKDASDAGILIVSSAGNGDTAGVEYPAAYEEVIAVGGVDTSAKKTEESAVGEEVELVAPGEQILSDSMLGLETVVSGTSMAAPHVTAAAAVLWQKDKTKSPAFIRSLLAQTANELGDSDEYGNGLVDLEYALAHYDEFAANYQEPEAEVAEAEAVEIVEEQLIRENEAAVETYEDVDYVEGRWGKSGHQTLVDGANNENSLGMTEEELAIFKLGAIYPDEVFKVADDPTGSLGNKNWHGGFSVNYIANYRFVTKVAKYAGDKTDCTSTKGQSTQCYNQMKKLFKTSGKINGQKWVDIIYNDNVNGRTYSYGSLTSDSQKKKWRKLFLYGMASHIVTDAFSHSAYCRCGVGGALIKVSNRHDDDDPGQHPTRFSDAQEAMNMVITNYQYSLVGSEIDFSPRYQDWNKKRGYCLRNLLKHARTAGVDSTEAELIQMFSKINYEP